MKSTYIWLSNCSIVMMLCMATECYGADFVLLFDFPDRPETQANLQTGTNGFYDPEFNGFDVMLPLDGIRVDGSTGTLLTAQLSGFGSDGAVSEPVRTHDQGAGVSNDNGTAVNGGDTIEISFDQSVIIRSFSVAFTTAETNIFYRVGDLPPVGLVLPEVLLSQQIDIPDIALAAGDAFTVGSNDNQFFLWETVIAYSEPIPEPSSLCLLLAGVCLLTQRHAQR